MGEPSDFELGMKRRVHMHLAIAHLNSILEHYYGREWPQEKWSEEVAKPIEEFIKWLEEECPGVA